MTEHLSTEIVLSIRDRVLEDGEEAVRETVLYLKDCQISQSREVKHIHGSDGTLHLEPDGEVLLSLTGTIIASPLAGDPTPSATEPAAGKNPS